MITKKQKSKLSLTLIFSVIGSGIIISLFFILPGYLDVSNYRTTNDFTIEYSEGFSGVNLDFRMSHRTGNSFDTFFFFQTISSMQIEEIGITEVSFNVFNDESLIRTEDLDFPEPLTYTSMSYIISNVGLRNNISCIGTIKAQFNVAGILQEETFDFILSIFMPIEPLEIRNEYLLTSIWIYTGLGFGLLVLVLLIYKTATTWKHKSRITVEEMEKKQEFFGYISSKVKESKKNS